MRKLRPPRCIKDVARPPSAQARAAILREYGSNCDVYGVGPATEKEPYRIWVTLHADEDEPCPPVVVGATPTQPVFTFDDRRDGYDAEMVRSSEDEDDDDVGALVAFECSACDGKRFHCTAGFQQIDDPLEGMDPVQAPPVPVEDLFGWFVLVAECVGCGGVVMVIDAECA